VVLVVLALGGLATWLVELNRGMVDLAIDQQVVWGLYIAGFFTAAGAGAGLLVLAASQAMRPWLAAGQLARLLAAGLACFGVAGALIVMDVGSPLGVWRIAVSGRWTSLMVWDFYLLLAGLVVALIAWLSVRGGSPARLNGALAVVMALVAIGIVVAESWMLSTQAARPYWESGLTTLGFLAGAAVAAFGLGLLLVDGQPRELMRRGLGWSLAIAVLIVLVDLLAGVLAGNLRAAEASRLLVTNPLFWLYLVVGVAIPLLLVIPRSAAGFPLLLGAALAVAGVLLEKTVVLAVGQAQPWLPETISRYLPAWIEIAGVVGLAAAGVVAYGVLVRLRRVEP
jgi:molybdopterin-containing oxidoreductase family membrane subunit